MALSASDFEYRLPEELIAQRPLRHRDQARLMLLRRLDGTASHHVFNELPALLRGGDLLVLNDTRVIPAKFRCRRKTAGRIDGLFLREVRVGRWEVMLKGAGRCRRGEALEIAGGRAGQITLTDNLGRGKWVVDVRPPRPAREVLEVAGRTPLPPYIHRGADEEDALDRRRYQTIYATRDGAVAAPTAGLHFTKRLLAGLAARGVATCRITLHVGAGTFLPVKTEDLRRHRMHSEQYELSGGAADALNTAKRERRRIVAVGTTTVRVLETLAAGSGPFVPATGQTDVFIYPPAEFRAVDALITNFHLPRSTLLMLAAAFCSPGGTDGLQTILAAYGRAVRQRYRFYSYGDAMLIE